MHVSVCVYTDICICKTYACTPVHIHTQSTANDRYCMYNSDVIGCYTALYMIKLRDCNKKVPAFPYYPLRNTASSKRRFLVLLTLFLIHLSDSMTNGFISTNKPCFLFMML